MSWLAVLLGVCALALACGGDSKGGTTDPGADGGCGGTGGTGGNDKGGDDGEGGDGGGDGVEPDTSCEQLCDFARDTCGWLDESSSSYQQERAACLTLCSEMSDCIPEATMTCDVQAFEGCFLSSDETPACKEMCDHVYYECEASFGVSRAQCGVGCSAGAFDEAQVACLTASSCGLDELGACLADEEEPAEPDACEAACAHVVDECEDETWSITSCTRACKASYTADQRDCLAGLTCGDDPVQTCFGELSCTAMCDHVYNECGSAVGDGAIEDCEVLCNWGLVSDTEVICFSAAACTDLAACDENVSEEPAQP